MNLKNEINTIHQNWLDNSEKIRIEMNISKFNFTFTKPFRYIHYFCYCLQNYYYKEYFKFLKNVDKSQGNKVD